MKNDDFLSTYYAECQKEMRWRREVEFKLMSIVMSLNATALPIVIALINFTKSNKIMKIGLSFSIVIALVSIALLVSRKINQERHIYNVLGEHIVKIWTYFEMFKDNSYLLNESILDDRAKKIGSGKGHRRTIHVIWGVTIPVSILILTAGILSANN